MKDIICKGCVTKCLTDAYGRLLYSNVKNWDDVPRPIYWSDVFIEDSANKFVRRKYLVRKGEALFDTSNEELNNLLQRSIMNLTT